MYKKSSLLFPHKLCIWNTGHQPFHSSLQSNSRKRAVFSCLQLNGWLLLGSETENDSFFSYCIVCLFVELCQFMAFSHISAGLCLQNWISLVHHRGSVLWFSWVSTVTATVLTDWMHLVISATVAINPLPSSQAACLQCPHHDILIWWIELIWMTIGQFYPSFIRQMECMFSHIIVLLLSSLTRNYAENP